MAFARLSVSLSVSPKAFRFQGVGAENLVNDSKYRVGLKGFTYKPLSPTLKIRGSLRQTQIISYWQMT